MESRKRIIRQHIKSALQKTLLPLCYKLSKKKDIDKKLVILADLNSVSTPESMELIKAELQSRGYVNTDWEEFSEKWKPLLQGDIYDELYESLRKCKGCVHMQLFCACDFLQKA